MLLKIFRGVSGYPLKLPAKMLYILISAPGGNLADTLGIVNQIFLCHTDPAVDDIINAGDAEGFL